jgi:predicted nucleic acid-binding protein
LRLGIDTDVLVGWAVPGAIQHERVAPWLGRQLEAGVRLALAPQVLYELIHVVTDRRRFEAALSMEDAVAWVEELCRSEGAEGLPTPPQVVPRALSLLRQHRLGRKRILDTALAATLEAAGVKKLATLNGRDFEIFPFLEVIAPE